MRSLKNKQSMGKQSMGTVVFANIVVSYKKTRPTPAESFNRRFFNRKKNGEFENKFLTD